MKSETRRQSSGCTKLQLALLGYNAQNSRYTSAGLTNTVCAGKGTLMASTGPSAVQGTCMYDAPSEPSDNDNTIRRVT